MKLNIRNMTISDPGRETKFYMTGAGLVASTQDGCNGDDGCKYAKKDLPSGVKPSDIKLLGHTHVKNANRILSDRIRGPNEIVNDLLRNVPGPGDANPLASGYISGVITPDDYRYMIQRIDGKEFAEYLGGGNDPDFGRYVQRKWVPNMTPKELRKMVEDYGHEKNNDSSN